jgi:uncharacterized protein
VNSITDSRRFEKIPQKPAAGTPFHILAKPIGPLCNLDCEYCYYLCKSKLFKGSKFRISDEILEKHIKDYIESQPVKCQEVAFAWQGGEPTLLGVDFFRKVVKLQDKYRKTGLEITNALQTNGTKLDDQWCKFLKENDFLVGISLDGPARLHDRYRKTRGGRGSFDQVKRGLDNLIKHQVEFNALTTIQRDNGGHPLEVYRALKEFGVQHMQFIPIVERLGDWTVSKRSVLPEQYGKFMNSIFDEWLVADIGRIHIQQFESALSTIIDHRATVCVHSKQCGRGLVLEHNGDVFACDHFVFDDFRIGNIAQETYVELVDGEQQRKFGEAKEKKLTNRCKRCNVRHFCNGGCMAHRFVNLRNEKYRQNYLCEGYRAFFKHAQPCLEAIAQALRNQLPANQYHHFLARSRLIHGRNSPCPCGSGNKFKKCCG